MDNHLTYLDMYCERAGDASLWAEPLNAVTNLAFMVFAWLLWRQVRGQSLRAQGDVWALAVAMAAIGLGSGLWHTHAKPWSMLADVIPIYLFINVYLFSLFRRVFEWSWLRVCVVWLAFTMLSVGFEVLVPPDLLNGSIMYAPSWGLMVLSGLGLWLKGKRDAGRAMLVVAGVFTLSVLCRTMDMAVCDTWPVGTHFLWHLLNAWVLYRLVGLVRR